MFKGPKLVTEPCGCRYDIRSGIRTRTCDVHYLTANFNELCARLRRERDEILLELVNVVSQACSTDEPGVITSGCVSAYASAIDLLAKYALVEPIDQPASRWRKARFHDAEIRRLES